MEPLGQRARRFLRWIAAASILVVAAMLVGKALWSPAVAFLSGRGPAEWILYPTPSETGAHARIELVTVFRRSFALEGPPAHASLRLRAFRRFEIALNGQTVAASIPGRSWKQESETEVATWLRAGTNQLEVRVANEDGPPALWLVLELPAGPLVTDQGWEAACAGATSRSAALATEPMLGHRFDPDRLVKSPGQALARRWPTLLGLAVLAALTVGMVRRLRRRWPTFPAFAQPALGVAMLASLAWIALFINNHPSLDPVAGFDARHHLTYIQYILDHGALPSASVGFQTYQPPLYYLVGAALLKVVGATTRDAGGILALRGLGLLCGLGNLFIVAACLRRLFHGNERRQVLGMIVAACLPCQLYLYQFPTNEMLLVTLASATLLATLRMLDADDPPWSRCLTLGICLGLALLAKVSGVLLALAVLGILVAQLAGRARWAGGLSKLATTALVALAIGGWHYLRLWAGFGSPLAGSWANTVGEAWWQDPGYHTWHDYVRFGRALAAPMFAGFAGLADGVYSTLWGEALAAGAPDVGGAPAWSYDVMSMGYLVALIPTVAFLLGGLANLVAWLRRPNLAGTLLAALGVLAVLGIIYVSLRAPSIAHTKAFHGMFALVPFAVCAAVGLDWPLTRWPWSAHGVQTAIVTWGLLAFVALWIDSSSPRAMTARGLRSAAAGDLVTGTALLRTAAAGQPSEWPPRIALAKLMTEREAPPEVVRDWLTLEAGRPDLATRHLVQTAALDRHERIVEAVAEARQGIALDADLSELHAAVGELLAAQGDREGAVQAFREVLRISPHSRTAHARLGHLLHELGRDVEAAQQLDYAARLPDEGR
jgi:hypothetical protein